MPREFPVACAARAAFLAALLLAHAAAFAGKLTAALDVAAGKTKSVRLTNMPQDTAVTIEIQTSAAIQVAFVRIDAAKPPAESAAPEFQGNVEKALSFGVTIPRTGDYLLVLDNRKGEGTRAVKLLIRADKPTAAPPAPAPPRPAQGKGTETRI